MQWQYPPFLYLILPCCAGWLMLTLYSRHRRQRAREAFADRQMWSSVMPSESSSRFWFKFTLRELAIISGLVALAGPQFGTELETMVPRGSDLYVLIDVSRSMLADDVTPSRLGRAKADVSSLVNQLDGQRIGLIAFAGQAVVKCPLTVDYDSFRRALDELEPGSAPRGGTAIGDAIRKAVEVFDANAFRDQSVLLITDGDDQESYPLEAAAIAAERKVTVFTVGLGDAEKGSRVPDKNATSFVEHQGQQVWSKLNSDLLEQIALKTSGVFIPAGTRAYDLGQLYTDHLQGRKGKDGETRQRVRRSERFQIFLAIALFALLVDVLVSPYQASNIAEPIAKNIKQTKSSFDIKSAVHSVTTTAILFSFLFASSTTHAGDEAQRVREGIALYRQSKYDEAGKAFAAAGDALEARKSDKKLTAIFNQACAQHRAGDFEKARDLYLEAGLSQDREIAVASHFNLATMAAQQAKQLAGEAPDQVTAEKREQILSQLKSAVASFRHCLELENRHEPARRNLELVRNWIKYYSDRWREVDRQKKRDESNLIQFLEFLIQTQSSILETVKQLPKDTPSNERAEIKRAQDELRDELPTLRSKIDSELRGDPQQPSANVDSQVQQGIELLQSWVDEVDQKMETSSNHLTTGDTKACAEGQQAAVEALDRIWDAVIPFRPLLAKELDDQTKIATALRPAPETDTTDEPTSDKLLTDKLTSDDSQSKDEPSRLDKTLRSENGMGSFTRWQQKILRKAKLLGPKAAAELEALKNQNSSPKVDAADSDDAQAADDSSKQSSPDSPQADPELIRAGLEKAIKLAPEAVQAMQAAVKHLTANDTKEAAALAEQARRILQEIQEAQPPNQDKKESQDQEKSQDQDKQNQKDEQNQDKQSDSKDQKSPPKDPSENQPGKQPESKQPDQKDPDQKEPDQKSPEQEQKSESQNTPSQKPQSISKDQIEDALRRVRERQQEKRERDRTQRARVIGPAPVDKDW
jgi:Ca-activated chloride channel homolog